MIVISLILTIILRFCLLRENNRRTNLSSEEYQREAAIEEPCDRVSTHLILFNSNIVLLLSLASRRSLHVVTMRMFVSPNYCLVEMTSKFNKFNLVF